MASFYTFAFLFLHVKCSFQQVSLSLNRDGNTFGIGNLIHEHGYKLDVAPLASLELGNEIKCISSCVKSEECFSANVRKQSKEKYLCELLNTTKYRHPEKLTPDEGTTYWYPKSVCASNPCRPSGSCTTKTAIKDPMSFTCACNAEGISGKYCHIYNKTINFALLKPTVQSSTLFGNIAGGFLSKYAVDGIKASTCTPLDGGAACAHSFNHVDQWWRVDLQVAIPVGRVEITSRNDYQTYLIDMEIKIGNSLMNEGRDNPTCGDRHTVARGVTKAILCSPPLSGRYVVYQSFSNKLLVLMEVEVYAAGP